MQPPDKNNLLRFLSGQASPDEAERVESWLASSKENQREFNRLWQLWALQGDGKKYEAPDVAKDWQRLKSRIEVPAMTKQEHSLQDKHSVSARMAIRPLARYGAAKLAAILGAATVLTVIGIQVVKTTGNRQGETAGEVIRHSSGAIVRDTLAGQTVVTLGPNSTVIYGGAVNTLLQGEAYIQRPAGENPFVMAIGQLRILADGGNFLLDLDSTTGLLHIQVFKGEVKIVDKGLVKPIVDSQSIAYNVGLHRLVDQKATDPNEIAFATGVYSFQNASLDEIARTLAKNYHVAILLGNPAIRGCRMTVQFDNLPIKEVLDIIAATLNITYEIEKDGKTIQINGQGCL